MAKSLFNKRKESSNTENQRIDKTINSNYPIYLINKNLGHKIQLKGYSREDGEKCFMTTKIQEAIDVLHFFNSYEKIEIIVECYIDVKNKITHTALFNKEETKFSGIIGFLKGYQELLTD